MASSPSIVWFRDDLRLTDNPALRAALDRDEPIVALYLLDEESDGVREIGGAARWWLHGSLASLGERLEERGGRLVLRRGRAADVVPSVVAEVGAGAVFWNRRYGGAEREIDAGIKEKLRDDGVTVASFAANLLYEPWTVRTQSDKPYGVYSPFAGPCRSSPPRARRCRKHGRSPASTAVSTVTTSARGACCPRSPTGPEACARRGSPESPPRRHV